MKTVRFYHLFIGLFFIWNTSSFSQNYSPNESLRTTLRTNVWKTLKEKTPKKQRFMTGLFFNTNQCFNLFEQASKKRGWPTYSPATILAFREVVIQEAIIKRDFTENEILMVYEKTKMQLSKVNADTVLNQQQLQEKYDPLILEALWIDTLTELIKGKTDDAKKLALELSENKLVYTPKMDRTANKATHNSTKKNKEPARAVGNNPLVEDVILRTVTNYGLNGAYIENEVSVLFRNGDLITNPSRPIKQLDIKSSKIQSPKKWATWRKEGSVLWVTKAWKNKTYDWKKYFKLRPAKEGAILVGTYFTSDAFGGDRVVNASTVSFNSQGKFAWNTIKGGDTPWLPTYSNKNSAGTYKLDGHTITLQYNNGKEESFFFGFYPKDNQHFVIGPGHFVPKRK